MFKLIKIEPNRDIILHIGSYNECCDVFELQTGIEFYDGVTLGDSTYVIEHLKGE